MDARGGGLDAAQILELPQAARIGGQHQDALAEIGRLHDAVGHEEDRHLCRLPDVEQLFVEAVAGDLVERAEGLVHQQDARTRQQRARDRDPLSLAARELMRIGVLATGEADHA